MLSSYGGTWYRKLVAKATKRSYNPISRQWIEEKIVAWYWSNANALSTKDLTLPTFSEVRRSFSHESNNKTQESILIKKTGNAPFVCNEYLPFVSERVYDDFCMQKILLVYLCPSSSYMRAALPKTCLYAMSKADY
ncbi:hypothetical protein M513_11450 [Trichuris suis]|uniref:Uncharacterized protein n=1 Tax=Trichuris suis TaxID=68888 RepID=A0A085LRR3_9BILA|nr:hypothetical protein M513_11450 [Trichuris suis]